MKNKVEFKGYLGHNGIIYGVSKNGVYYLKEPISIVPHKLAMSKEEMEQLVRVLMQQTFKVTIERVK